VRWIDKKDFQIPGFVSRAARVSRIRLQTLEIVVSIATLSSARFLGRDVLDYGVSAKFFYRCIQFDSVLKNKPLLLLVFRQRERGYVKHPVPSLRSKKRSVFVGTEIQQLAVLDSVRENSQSVVGCPFLA